MSISKPKIENPCTKFIEFKGDKGQFFYYDKEKEEQVEIMLPIYFVVLDELSTITGYNKKNDCGIYSNEVHSTVNELLRVKTFKGGESIIGKYSDIKDSIKALGGKYTKSVYSLMIHKDKSTELVNFKFRGASFSAWLDKKIRIDNSVISVSEFKQETNGNTTYMVPIFDAFKMTSDLRTEAIRVDEILQNYLIEYKAQQPEKEIAKAEAVDTTDEFVANDKWHGSANKEAIVNASKEDMSSHPEDLDNNLDDLPFIFTIPIALGFLAQFINEII